MFRPVIVCMIVLAGAAASRVDVSACGDKFLRVGRSGRLTAYAPVHRVSIVIYPAADARRDDVKDFAAVLKRAGHNPVVVDNAADLARVLAAAPYDVVIGAYRDVANIKQVIAPLMMRPGIIPLLNKPKPDVAAAAEREFRSLLRVDRMNLNDVLAEIDHFMDVRLKDQATATAQQ